VIDSLKIIISSLVIIVAMPIFASDDHDEAKQLVDSGEILALEVILLKARKIHKGKVLDVELEMKDNRKIYEVELLTTDGIVFELKFDARTGKHISTEKEN